VTTAILADWGADVIKVEGPDSPDPGRSLIRYEVTPGGPNAYFETHNRNKRGIVLDLKSEGGRRVFYRLGGKGDPGEPETPPTRTFNGFADQVSAFLLAYGIVLALFHRERTGQGQMVDGSLLQGQIAAQAFNITSYLMSGTSDR